MNRRDFIKQAAVTAAGTAIGASLPVLDSRFPGVVGVDLASPGPDKSAVTVFDGHTAFASIVGRPISEDEIMKMYLNLMAMSCAVPAEMLGNP